MPGSACEVASNCRPPGRSCQYPVRHWKTEVVINQLEMLSGRGKKEYAKEAQTIAEAGPDGHPAELAETNGAGDAAEASEEALVAL